MEEIHMWKTALKGLLLAAVFGGVAYLFTQKLTTSLLIAFVMFMSMFVKPKQQ